MLIEFGKLGSELFTIQGGVFMQTILFIIIIGICISLFSIFYIKKTKKANGTSSIHAEKQKNNPLPEQTDQIVLYGDEHVLQKEQLIKDTLIFIQERPYQKKAFNYAFIELKERKDHVGFCIYTNMEDMYTIELDAVGKIIGFQRKPFFHPLQSMIENKESITIPLKDITKKVS